MIYVAGSTGNIVAFNVNTDGSLTAAPSPIEDELERLEPKQQIIFDLPRPKRDGVFDPETAFSGQIQMTIADSLARVNCYMRVTIVIGWLSDGLSTYKTAVLLQTFLDGRAQIDLENASDLSGCVCKAANSCDNNNRGGARKFSTTTALCRRGTASYQSEPDWG